MTKGFYNIWIILIFFTLFSSNFNVSDRLYVEANNHQATLQSFQNKFHNQYFIVDPVTATVDPPFATICSFEELQLTASGGDNYLWVPNPGNPSGGTLNNYNIYNPIFSNGFPGSFYIYDVIVSDNDFPPNADTARVIISIFNNPSISISPSPGIFVCENEEVVLTANGGVSYVWEEAMTGDSLGEGTNLTVFPTSTTIYRVKGTDSNGCWEFNDIQIVVEEVNVFANASEPGVCDGESVELTGGTGNQLTWLENGNPIGTGSSIIVSPSQTTTYDLMVETVSGCQDSAQVLVEYYESPEILNPIESFSSCDGFVFPVGIQINQQIDNYLISSSGSFENDEVHGNLLTFDAFYSGDTTFFSVTLFGENGGCSVVESFEIVPCECDPPSVSSVSVENAKCNGKLGTATIFVEDEAAYFYNWTPDLGIALGQGNSRTELPFGAYNIEIIDTSNFDCSTFIDVIINHENGPEVTVETTPATCLSSNGSADLNPSDLNFLWEDSVVSNARSDLSAGKYNITVTDPFDADCSSVLSIEIFGENLLSAGFNILNNPDCGQSNGKVSFDVLNGSNDYTFEWQDGFVSNDSVRDALSAGFYEVTIVDNGPAGCEFPFQFVLSNVLNTAEINFIAVNDVSCKGLENGWIDFEINFDSTFVFEADTVITDGSLVYENGKLPAGEFCLYLFNGNECIIDETCFTVFEPEALEAVFEVGSDCGLGGEITIDIAGGTTPYTFDWGDVPGMDNEKNRNDLLSGNYAVTIYDSNGCALINDNIVVTNCSDDCDFFGVTDTLNLELEDCFSEIEYCFPIAINDLQNCQILYNGDLYLEPLQSCNLDTFMNGYQFEFGSGFHEIIVIDTLFDCVDVLFVNVSCSNTDNVCINETKSFCVDAEDLNLIGEIESMTNICPALNDSIVSFELDFQNLCVMYNGNEPGTDSICVEICDFLGNCDSFELRVTVENCLVATPDFFKDTVFIDETMVFCPDTTELPGEIVSIQNFCANQSGDFVDFFLDQNNFCVEYTGLDVGVDSACIEICDNLGFCDTTFMCILVEEIIAPPIAEDDCDTTNMGTPVVINVVANDTVFGRVTSTRILEDPMWGAARFNLDRSITYNASNEFCERIDSFSYEICTEGGCDSASVCVWIACVDIFIFTAVSANKDGVNDVFYIAGIEEYPESVLRIFNRWGNMVYEKENYQNSWSGTYDSQTDLPDGTYFYLLELNDEDKRVFKGYLELFR